MKPSDQLDQERMVARVQKNPRFAEFVYRKTRFGLLLSIIMLVIYYGFLILLAFTHVLSTPITKDAVTTWGIPAGIFVIVSCFVLTGLYVRRANTEFDELNAQIVKESQS